MSGRGSPDPQRPGTVLVDLEKMFPLGTQRFGKTVLQAESDIELSQLVTSNSR